MSKERNLGIDLLRLVLMLLIIIGHLYTHSGLRATLPLFSIKWSFTWITQTITICAVDCFILISGYYGHKSKYNLFKVVTLWSKVLFYSLTITIIAVITGYTSLNVSSLLDAVFPVLREVYWFITNYLLLSILSPFLNLLINQLDQRKARVLGAIIVLVFYIEPVFSIVFIQFDTSEGLGIIGFVTLYLLGAIIEKTGMCLSRGKSIVFLFINSMIMFLSKVVLSYITITFNLEFGTGLFYHYNTILVLVNAVMLLLLFKNIHPGNKLGHIINIVKKSILAVYLIHENPIIRKVLWNDLFTKSLERMPFFEYIFCVVGVCVAILIVCLIVDLFFSRVLFTHVLNSKLSISIQKNCEKYNRIINCSGDYCEQ